MESHPVYKVIFCHCHAVCSALSTHVMATNLCLLNTCCCFLLYFFILASLCWLQHRSCDVDCALGAVFVYLQSQISFRFYPQHGSSVVWSECNSARMTTGNQLSLWSSGGQMWKLHTPLSQVIISNDIMHKSWVLDTKHMQKPQRKTLFNAGHSSPSPQARGAVTKCNHIR